MSTKGQVIPHDWPEKWRRPLGAALEHAKSAQRRKLIIYAARRHVAFCLASEHAFLSFTAILAHKQEMKASISQSVASTYAHLLSQIAVKGDEARLRDQIREHFSDTRRLEEIINEPYMPRQVRRLAPRAIKDSSLSRRHILALDLYARVVDREGVLPREPQNIVGAFWFRPPGERNQCAIFGHAAYALDLLLPGSPDIPLLRIAQRSVRQPSNSIRRKRRDIPSEIDQLVENARQVKRANRGRRYSPRTKREQCNALMTMHDLLAASGRPFSLDRDALNMFADHANSRFRAHRAGGDGWSAVYVARTLEKLALFVNDDELKRDILLDARDYHNEAGKEPKRKERILLENPVTLPRLYQKAQNLVSSAEGACVKSRSQLLNTAGALGLLCFYPLRRADLAGLRFGIELHRVLSGWCLASLPTQKTGLLTEPLRLPVEATPIIDAALLQGVGPDHLWATYKGRKGQCLWSDWRTGKRQSVSYLWECFKDLVGYSPHLLRTIWADYLVSRGADRLKISVVLQHKSLISQEEYEVLAAKYRINKAIEEIVEIADEVA